MAVPLVTAPAAFKPSFIIPPEIAKYPLKLDNAIVFPTFLSTTTASFVPLLSLVYTFKAPFSK